MIFLILSILFSALIYVVFKLIGHYKVHTFSAIVVNYLAACFAGFFLSSSNPFTLSVFKEEWFPVSSIIGIMFIIMFYVIGKSTQKAGVAVTTVAVKMSVVIPIAFSIYLDGNDLLTLLKFTGIVLAILSVFLTIYKRTTQTVDLKSVLLPAFLFIGMGVVDSFVKFAQSSFISNELTPVFSSVVFAVALASGILVLPFNKGASKSFANPMAWLLGIVLGIVNFGSMYFLILALNYIDIKTGIQAMGSVVFGINNIGIVALSVIIGFILFGERPSRINWIGIALSGVAIIVLFFS
jgi:drug/metabolite transporter (DMT)-like permease